MTTLEIAEALGVKTTLDKEVLSVCTDTRKIEKGCIFFALKGANFDGHSFVKQAIEMGAVCAVTEFQIGNSPCIVVENTRKALLDLAKYYRAKFSPVLVGVTGSVGKTTSKEMIALALSAKYKTLRNEGNLNNEIGVPMTLFGLDDSYGAAVIEMGMNHFGEINRLSSTAKPTISVITNIGYSHIENLGSQEGILKAKMEILNGMSIDSPIILNADDEMLSTVALERKIITYGIENEAADVRAVNISGELTSSFDILYNGNEYHVALSCYGIHNVYNAAAAFAVGVSCGIEPEVVAEKLGEYETSGMRQNVKSINGQTVIVDCYNASPASMKAALNVLSQMRPKKDGRRVAVLADMLELGEMSAKLHGEVGEYVVKMNIDKLICYGKDAKYIAAKADELGLHSGCTSDKLMLIEYLRKTLREDDVVLFKGSRGMKLEEIIEELYKEENEG